MPPPELSPPELEDEGGEASAPTARERRGSEPVARLRCSEAEELRSSVATPAIATYQKRRGSSTW